MENGRGRLLGHHGGVRRLLDHVRRGLIGALVWLAAGLLLGVTPTSSRASENPSYDAAFAYCQANFIYSSYTECRVKPGASQVCGYNIDPGSYAPWGQCRGFTGDPPNQCKGRPSYRFSLMVGGSPLSVCRAGCKYAPVASPDGDGQQVNRHCVKWADGSYKCQDYGTMAPTGDYCDGGPTPDPPDPPPPPPQLCGGGSCYDPNTGNYCAVGGNGQQVCVKGPAPGQSGGCISGGDTTLCAGNPPPLPDKSNVPDPPTNITASDTHTDQPQGPTGPAGPVSNTTINNYNNGTSGGTGQPNNGAGSGDVAPPASSSSAPKPAGDGTKASGGGDCNTPPICEGSAATCMVVTQTWLLRCPPGSGGAGVPSNDGDTSVPGLEGIGDGPGPGFFTEAGAWGLDKLDATGFGGGQTCPAFPVIRFDALGFVYDQQPPGWCEILSAFGKVVMLLGAFFALRILASK